MHVDSPARDDAVLRFIRRVRELNRLCRIRTAPAAVARNRHAARWIGGQRTGRTGGKGAPTLKPDEKLTALPRLLSLKVEQRMAGAVGTSCYPTTRNDRDDRTRACAWQPGPRGAWS